MPIHRSLAALLFALLILADAVAPAHAQPVNPPDRLLTDMLVGAPIAAGQYIFWKQRDADQLALYGYDLATGTRFVVAQPADALAALASDGAVVAWTVQRPPDRTLAIQSYDLRSHAVSTILSGIGGASEI